MLSSCDDELKWKSRVIWTKRERENLKLKIEVSTNFLMNYSDRLR